jgi:predicted nucleic acid-binding protein
MAKIVLDANVIVGWLDQSDSLNARATKVLDDIYSAGDSYLLLDFIVEEAVSVACRRACQRKTNAPDLPGILEKVKRLYQRNEIEFVHGEIEDLYPDVLEIVGQSAGALNFNDAALIVLQQRGLIGEVATFDGTLASHPDFRSIA